MSLIEEIKKPFNLVTLILTISSIIMSIYFYYDSIKVKKILYEIVEPTSLIYDSENSSSTIKLIINDSIPIRENVYLFTGKIWNGGDLPILQTDIRKDLTFYFADVKRILDFKIVRQREDSIANFKLVKENDKSLKVNWNYFDPGYGFIYQVIYVGEEDAKFEMRGKILDISRFDQVINRKQLKLSISKGYSLFTLVLIGLIFILWRLYVRRVDRFFSIAYTILAIVYVFMAYYIFIKYIFINSPVI